MSGVTGKKFGRKYSRSSERASSLTYSMQLPARVLPREVRVGLREARAWPAPHHRARVNASARKTTSRSTLWTSLISHSQKGNGFVCGLSTRKTFTPASTQKQEDRSHASHRPRQSSHSQLTL